MSAEQTYILATANESALSNWQEALGPNANVRFSRSKAELEKRLAELKPKQYFLDLSLPDLQGVTGVSKLISAHPDSFCLAFSPVPQDNEGILLLQAGVRAYCNRFIDPSLLTRISEMVDAGEVWVGPAIMERLIRQLPAVPTSANNEKLANLTEREREIANLIANGESNKVIANALDIGERTVKAHLSAIFHKTGVKDRLQLALLVKGV